MWGTVLQVNSLLWVMAAVFMVYSAGNAILTWSWKQFVLSILLFAFLSVTEITFAALQEP